MRSALFNAIKLRNLCSDEGEVGQFFHGLCERLLWIASNLTRKLTLEGLANKVA